VASQTIISPLKGNYFVLIPWLVSTFLTDNCDLLKT
jgi:hypothetical protein